MLQLYLLAQLSLNISSFFPQNSFQTKIINIAFLLDISRKNIKRKSHGKITIDDVTGSGLVSEVHVNFHPFFERLLLTGGLYII